jgi:hypothetical protein
MPMIKEPTEYEQRIGDYMEMLRLSLKERKDIWGRLGCHKLLLGRTVKDIFLSDNAPESPPDEIQSLWVFTSDAASELRDGKSKIEIDFRSHNDVRYVKLVARESDLFSVGPNSTMTMEVTYAGGQTARLIARGVNCLKLLTLFRKYFSRHVSP